MSSRLSARGPGQYLGAVAADPRWHDEDELVHQLLAGSPNAVVAFDQHRRIYYVNARAEQLFGYSSEELLGAAYETLVPERLRDVLRERLDAYFARPEPRPFESRPDFPARRKDGTEFPMQYAATPISTGDGIRVIGALIDVSAEREQSARLESLGRSYLTMARMNQAAVRAPDADTLFAETCEVAVADGGFLGAWVGRIEGDGDVVAVARCGTLNPDPAPASDQGEESVGEVPEPSTGASVCLRLHCEGRQVAVLTLHAEDADAFDGPARRLLEEMARNVSFALDGFVHAERLEQVASQRHDLLGRLLTAQTAERERIAVGLHQDTVPALELADSRLRRIEVRCGDEASELRPVLDQIRTVLTGATESLRDLVFDLETPQADQGLEATMGETAAHVLFDRRTAWRVRAPDVALAAGQTRQAVRILREALINVRKHARAGHVDLTAEPHGDGVMFRVHDDGVGFGPQEGIPTAGHRGLVSMRERAERSGGWLRTGDAAAGGGEVVFWLPQVGPEDEVPL